MQFFSLHRATCALALLCAPAVYAQVPYLGDAPSQEPIYVGPVGSAPKASARKAAIALQAATDWYDTANREAVRTAYSSVFLPTSNVALGYMGNPAGGDAGGTTSSFKAVVLQRVNYFRAMAGVSSIGAMDPSLSGKAQLGALMLYANGALDHHPPTSWARYTNDGADSLGNGNLCQGLQSDTGCVVAYMDDFGGNNGVVGHRRFLLDPRVQRIGTGDIPYNSGGLWNVIYVNEPGTIFRSRTATREEFVSWPPSGYVPYPLLFNRWSFHLPNAGFTQANVALTRNGVAVPLRVESRSTSLPNYIYIPENSIVWIPDNLPTSPSNPAKPTQDTIYKVSISGVRVNGVSRNFDYDVVVFDPATAGASPPPSAPGTPNVVSFDPRNGSTYTGTFNATFSQSSGNHYLGYLLFLPTPNVVNYTAAGSCLVEYNKYSNGVRLIDNAGTGWLGPLEGVAIKPGAPALTNNQCSVDVANVVANVSGSTMSVKAPVTFFQKLGPVLGTFLQALDSNGVWTGMTQFGNWTLPGATQTRLGPSVVGVSASTTSGRQSTYTVVAAHTGGTSALSMVNLLASATLVGSPSCHIVYFPTGNTLNLVNDAGTGLVSASGIVAGQPGVISNSRCSVNAAFAVRSGGANTVTIAIPVTYSSGFAGQKFVYANIFDSFGLLSHWVTGSTMLVQ